MKSYPSIDGIRKALREGGHPLGAPCVAFYKHDGSNIRAEWSRKRGWYKFGTRKTLFDRNTPCWGGIPDLWEAQLAEPIGRVLRDNPAYQKAESVIAFAEYFGPRSFAGQHAEDDPKRLILFDLNVHKKGFVDPVRFAHDFAGDYRAPVVYVGDLNHEFIRQVREGEFPRLGEGVVCKGGEGHKLWMAKVKTDAWIAQVKSHYPDTWHEYHSEDDEG